VRPDLSLRKIRSFTMVAELGSFRRAAEQINISPSALSIHVRELEEALGVPLLYRTTRHVELTIEGERFLSRTQALFAGLDEIVDELKEEADLLRGRVTVACIPTFIARVLPPAMAAYTARFPGVSIQVLDIGSAAMAEAVKSGAADVGIGPAPEKAEGLEIEPMIDDRFVAVVPAGHPLANRREVSLAELAEFPFIGLNLGNSIRTVINRTAAEIGIEIKPAYEFVYHYSVGAMVAAGLGVTAVPMITFPLLNAPNLVTLPIASPTISREICLIRRKGGGLSPAVKEFITVLKTVLHAKPDTPQAIAGVARGDTGTAPR